MSSFSYYVCKQTVRVLSRSMTCEPTQQQGTGDAWRQALHLSFRDAALYLAAEVIVILVDCTGVRGKSLCGFGISCRIFSSFLLH